MSKIHFLYGGLGACIKAEIESPEIDKYCPKCNQKMVLTDGRGHINSGTNFFTAECPVCGNEEKFSDYKLWRECIGIQQKQSEQRKKQTMAECRKLISAKVKEFKLNSFTARLLKESLKNNNINTKELLDALKSATLDGFKTFNPKDIKYIYMGKSEWYNDNSLIFEFISKDNVLFMSAKSYVKENNKSVRKDIYIAEIEKEVNFTENLLKLIYLTGGKPVQDKSKNNYYYLQFKTENDSTYNLIHTNLLQHFSIIYFDYYLKLFDKKIMVKNKQKNLEKLISKYDKSESLYYYLKHFYDDFDFLYSIMAHLKTQQDLETFLLMMKKDEGAMNHRPMNSVETLVSEAFYLYNKPYKNYGYKPAFMKDIVQDYMKDKTSRKLHLMLYRIFKEKERAENIVIFLKTQKNKEKMIEFLESGETDKDKITYKMIELIRK